MTPRAVFDCMVFLQAAASDRGPAFACLRLAEEGVIQLCVDSITLAELADVLRRPVLRRKMPALSDDVVASFLDRIRTIALNLNNIPRVIELPRDPGDEPYINLAIAANARYLVTRDRDLLDLRSAADFRASYPHLRVVEPYELLREPWPDPQPDAF